MGDTNPYVRLYSAEALITLQKHVDVATKVLTDIAAREDRDAYLQIASGRALLRTDPDVAMAAFRRALKGNPIDAAMELGKMGGRAKATVPDLLELLGKMHQAHLVPGRSIIIDALGSIGPDAREAVPFLISIIDTEPVKVCSALGKIVVNEQDAMRVLGELRDRQDADLSTAAADAIGEIERRLASIKNDEGKKQGSTKTSPSAP
jgi:hypothetical protein